MGALGRVELPTNGLGNVGQGLHPSRIKHLQAGFRCHSREKSSHSAVICQRICQRFSMTWGGRYAGSTNMQIWGEVGVHDELPK